MASIADLFFTGRLDDGKLQIDAKKSGDKAGQTLGQSMAASIKQSFSGKELGKGLVQGLGLAGGLGAASLATSALSGLSDVIGSSIQAASDLNETVSKSKVIFGDSADEVEAWAKTMAAGFGQSEKAALDTASTFAGLFDTVGIAEDEARKKSIALTELGSDLASFFNTDVAQATEALRSGLSGESEPLRRFNVFLSEAAVDAKLLALGQKKVNGQWTDAQKILGRYQIILDQTTDAQGDFARTSDGLANSQRIVNAELENQQAALGQEFLPVALQVTKWQLDFIEGAGLVAGALGDLANGFGFLADKATTALDVLTFWDEQTHGTATWIKGTFNPALAGMGKSLGAAADSIGVDARDARKSIEGMGGASKIAADDIEKLKDALVDVTNAAFNASLAFGDQMFSADELKGHIADLTGQLRDQKQALNDLEAIKNPTKAQREDIIITKGEIANTRHEIFDTRVELAKLDATQLNALMAQLAKAQYRTDKLGDEAREALTAFQKLAYAEGKVTGYKGDPGYAPRAAGGSVYPGQTYMVGEKGPEWFVPNTSGMIVPHSSVGSAGTGGAGATYISNNNVTVQGLVKARDPFEISSAMERFQRTGVLAWPEHEK